MTTTGAVDIVDRENGLRLLRAYWRTHRGQDAPTLGRLFPDTPGVAHTSDDPPTARLLTLEEWAAEGKVDLDR